MGRLIREDDVMRMLTGVELNNGTVTDAKIELRNVKTAYDVEKVVAELESLSNAEADYYYATSNDVIDRENAIDIVRRGGVE